MLKRNFHRIQSAAKCSVESCRSCQSHCQRVSLITAINPSQNPGGNGLLVLHDCWGEQTAQHLEIGCTCHWVQRIKGCEPAHSIMLNWHLYYSIKPTFSPTERDLHQVKQAKDPSVNQNTGLWSNKGISVESYRAQPHLMLWSSLTWLPYIKLHVQWHFP